MIPMELHIVKVIYILTMNKHRGYIILISTAIIALLCICIYLTFRFFVFFAEEYSLLDRIFAICLLVGELFFFIHGIGYSIDAIKASRRYREEFDSQHYFLNVKEPKVAVFITAYNEDADTLENTISACTLMDYKNKQIYLLDDSTKPELMRTSKALTEKYGIEYVHRENRRGFKAGAINDMLNGIDAKYLLILDADQRPSYNFLHEVVPILEEKPELAFVQTPQYYVNRDSSKVSNAASAQQSAFYANVSEGKSVSNAMFACGTNIVLRVSALNDIGGFDEESVTEDFATSFMLHERGYSSYYYNNVFVEGDGPASIPGYYMQQMRWAYGTIGIFKKLLKELFRHPRRLTPVQWWEYILSGTWYFVGWAFFFMMICPVAYLLFEIRPLLAEPYIYVVAYLPYLLFSSLQFFVSMSMRGFSAKDQWFGQILTYLTFPIYMLAATYALINKKIPFVVTPKGGSGKSPLTCFWPQIAMMSIIFFSVAVGIWKFVQQFDLALIINILWSFYYLLLLSMFLYFRRDAEEPSLYYVDMFEEFVRE